MIPPTRASETWMSALPPCGTSQYRAKLNAGASPVFLLSPATTGQTPEWWFLMKSKDDPLFRVVSAKYPFCRRIGSLKVAYQTARMASLNALTMPINNSGTP